MMHTPLSFPPCMAASSPPPSSSLGKPASAQPKTSRSNNLTGRTRSRMQIQETTPALPPAGMVLLISYAQSGTDILSPCAMS
eukprot:959338-Rhodomonas_salina.1